MSAAPQERNSRGSRELNVQSVPSEQRLPRLLQFLIRNSCRQSTATAQHSERQGSILRVSQQAVGDSGGQRVYWTAPRAYIIATGLKGLDNRTTALRLNRDESRRCVHRFGHTMRRADEHRTCADRRDERRRCPTELLTDFKADATADPLCPRGGKGRVEREQTKLLDQSIGAPIGFTRLRTSPDYGCAAGENGDDPFVRRS